MERLGCPAGDQYGVTEMEEQGNNVFRAGLTITQGSEFAARTLAEVGWTEMRGLTKPIWIVVKR